MEVHATGLKVMYTELDINLLPNTPRGADPAIANPYANGLPDEVQQQLARRYADVFRLFLKHRNAVTRVTFWGLSDADSWLNRGRMNYPLLWDRQRRPNPAFDAVVEVLKKRQVTSSWKPYPSQIAPVIDATMVMTTVVPSAHAKTYR